MGRILDRKVTRRAAIGLAGAAGIAGLSLLRSGSYGVSESEFETLYIGDEEPECDEVEEKLTRPELIAHIGCAIALTAVDAEDYNQMLSDLNLYGTEPGKYTYSGGNICLHLHSNAAWEAEHGPASDSNHGNIFYYGIDEMPNRMLPHADALIDWKMLKGVLPEYGEYLDPRGDEIWLDAEHGVVKPEYEEAVARNQHNFTHYATFAFCGAVPYHINQAVGLNYHPLEKYHWRTMPSFMGGSDMTLNEALPQAIELDDYILLPYDKNVPFDEFCQPGDMLGWFHYENPRAWHTSLYVGNEIAQRYFPGTTGNVVEAGGGGRFPGIVKYGDTPWEPDWMFVSRPKDGEVEMRQDLPPLVTSKGCEEPCRLTVGERIAHCACGIAMTAVGEQDYNQMLKNLGIYGSGVGLYHMDGRSIANTPGQDAAWLASQDPAKVERWVQNDGCACEFDHMAPDTRIPGAQKYIDFTMGKGVLPEYGVYIPEPLVREPEYAAQAAYNKAHISNHEGVPGYSRFCMCGTAVQHVVWAVGADETTTYDTHGKFRGRGWSGGVTSKGIPFLADPPHYNVYFPDHIYGQGSPMECEDWLCWSVDWTKPWVEQCEPGDLLYLGPSWSGEEPVDFVKHEHGRMYVGNDIVRLYFPNSHAIFAEAGGSGMLCGHFWGLDGNPNEIAEKGYRIYRPKNKDVEPRQWIPKIKGCPGE